MIIEIENTSSPGASFTPNTNEVLLKTYEWILEHKGIVLPFKDFRMRLQNEKKVNDNNNRNIYPLLKNGGLASYEKGADLHVDYFFTNTGTAYVKTLESIKLLEKEDYTKSQKEDAIRKFEAIQQEIVYGALKRILEQKDINYTQPMKNMISFLLKYDKISKIEFAYLLYSCKEDKNIQMTLSDMNDNVDLLRAGKLEIDVNVKVRNDLDIRKKTNSDNRKEGLTFLTSYTYFTSLLQQAGLVIKNDGYFCVNQNKKHLLAELGGK